MHNSIHYLLLKAHTGINRRILNRAAEFGLTPGRPKILEYLYTYGENNQKAIAEFCEIEQATAGTILLGMEKDGLIVRKQKDGNRRSLYVSLTEKGTQAAETMRTVFDEEDMAAEKYLTDEEKQQLKVLLAKVCKALNEADK